jgi:hypothetical protein
MISLTTTTGISGIGLAIFILFLIRRDHIYITQALFWMVVSVAAAILGLWPGLITSIASAIGIYYPPSALLLGVIVVLLIKTLYADMSSTRLDRQIRRLNQRLAMLEAQAPSNP